MSYIVARNYNGKMWYYLPYTNKNYRYILGTVGENPLVCIGINPSTANPGKLDRTLRKVEIISLYNGYNSWIMFNVYPQRATNPDLLHKVCCHKLHENNVKCINKFCSKIKCKTIWAAWGNLVRKREYLPCCLKDIVECLYKYDVKWLLINKTKIGHPRHPLFANRQTLLKPFNINSYISSL